MAKCEVHIAIAVFLALILIIMPAECVGEDQALEQLINMFEKKGLLSASEAGLVRQTLEKETEKLQKKEKEVEEKERALLKKEEELKAKEEALQEKTAVSSKEEKPQAADKAPGKEDKLKVGYEDLYRSSFRSCQVPEPEKELRKRFSPPVALSIFLSVGSATGGS